MATATRYGIAELASLSGVSRRTVRYYVHEGLISAPLGVGRGDHYTADHLDQLLRVKAMQDAGHTLDEIRHAVARKRVAFIERQSEAVARHRRQAFTGDADMDGGGRTVPDDLTVTPP